MAASRERYPCDWPRGCRSVGSLSEKQMLTRLAVSAVKELELSEGYSVRYASATQRGYYPSDLDKANQDAFLIAEGIEGRCDHLFGVFDGHGCEGDACAAYARDTSSKLALQRLAAGESVEAALTTGFLQANKNLAKSRIDDSLSGTTAIVAFLRGLRVTVANVGDSRVMLGTRFTARALSQDQTPYRSDERERILKCGGTVMSSDQIDGLVPYHEDWACDLGEEIDDGGDPPRVWAKNLQYPGTAFTRSIGDAVAEQLGVTAEPEFTTHDLCRDDRCLIVATDGVFEFITVQLCVDIALLYEDPADACRALVREAYKLWMDSEGRTDDITLIVLFVQPPPPPPPPPTPTTPPPPPPPSSREGDSPASPLQTSPNLVPKVPDLVLEPDPVDATVDDLEVVHADSALTQPDDAERQEALTQPDDPEPLIANTPPKHPQSSKSRRGSTHKPPVTSDSPA